jgi:hypothetical protein
MADAGGSRLNIGASVEKRGRVRPRGSKNKATIEAMVASSSALVKRRPAARPGVKINPRCHLLHQVQALLLLVLLLLRPESIPSSALSARSAVRFSGYR